MWDDHAAYVQRDWHRHVSAVDDLTLLTRPDGPVPSGPRAAPSSVTPSRVTPYRGLSTSTPHMTWRACWPTPSRRASP